MATDDFIGIVRCILPLSFVIVQISVHNSALNVIVYLYLFIFIFLSNEK
jgi:hypothetical protein